MIVIGCGKAKLDHLAPARELYIGSLFVAARKYAEWRATQTGVPWAILSARYGLVLPHEQILPYEQKLELEGDRLASWAMDAASRAVSLSGVFKAWTGPVECLASRAYCEPFRQALDGLGVASCEPLRGKGLGLRLQWLSRALGGGV